MELLNAVDGELENILSRSPTLLLPIPSSIPNNNGDIKSLEDVWDATTLQDLSALKQLITFTSHLLRNAMNKDVYNSAEHLVSLLRCLDDDLAFLTLSALTALSMPPLTHKCVDENRHSTTLHKQGNLCHPLFDIAEVVYKATKQVANVSFLSFSSQYSQVMLFRFVLPSYLWLVTSPLFLILFICFPTIQASHLPIVPSIFSR